MKQKKRPGGKVTAILLILLALLCIGLSELIACYFFAPALFQRVTAPVRHAAGVVSSAVTSAVSDMTESVSAWAAELKKPERPSDPEPGSESTEPVAGPELVEQLAGDPVIVRDAPISDPAITELQSKDGVAILTGGITPVVYFNQGEPPWADQPYGSDHIGGYGCGPTALAMAVSSITDQQTDPAQMAVWAVNHGHWAKGHGSYLSIVTGAAEAYGLTAAPISAMTPEAIKTELLSGHLLVALMGPGHFTDGGHFILLRGITLSGNVLIADPNSTERSLMEWDAQLILDELSASRSDGAPLWVFSRPLS